MEFIFRVFVAALLGGMIGFEREYRAKEAGLRTHFLVAMGSALFMIVSQYGFNAVLGTSITLDPSRVAAQVVSGIGFIGAGTIIFQKNVVRGLTTAAGLWVTAAIGLACGTGMYLAAMATTLLVLTGLEVLNAMIPRIGTTTILVSFSATSMRQAQQAIDRLKQASIDIHSYELKDHRGPEGKRFGVNMEIKVKRGFAHDRLFEYLEGFDDITVSCFE